MRKKKISIKLFTTVLTITFFISFLSFLTLTLFPSGLKAQDAEAIDYVLVLDESGSMRQNDPDDLRIEAAKLFTDLSSILKTQSRIAVVGFGQETNIYLDFTDIDNGGQEIKDALDNIKSDQSLTDLKDVLINVKEMLDSRDVANDSMVILLTDGAMTIDDIPPMQQGQEQQIDDDVEEDEERDIPSGQVEKESSDTQSMAKGDDEEEEEPEPQEEPDDPEEEVQGQKVDSQKAYLEEYKQQLLKISQGFADDGIKIHTIAFTEEAETDILKKISSRTDAGSWKAGSAGKIKDIYLEIFKHITSRFLYKEEQKGTLPLKGQIEIEDPYNEIVLIAFANQQSIGTQIQLSDSSGNIYIPDIEEDTYKILELQEPEPGLWDYSISGDAVIVYDLGDVELVEPETRLFLSGAAIDIALNISKPNPDSKEPVSSSFLVSYRVTYPDGSISEDLSFDYNQEEKRYSSVFSELYASGNYIIEIIIEHLPSGASSTKLFTVESIYMGLDIEIIEPSSYEYYAGEEVPVQIKIIKRSESDYTLDLSSLEIFAKTKGLVGDELILNDLGIGPDEQASDGIYSTEAIVDESGSKELDFFIYYNPLASREIDTGIKTIFSVAEPKTSIIEEEAEETPQESIVETVEETDDIEREEILDTIDFYWKIIIIVASLLAAGAIFLMVYFLYIRPKKRGY